MTPNPDAHAYDPQPGPPEWIDDSIRSESDLLPAAPPGQGVGAVPGRPDTFASVVIARVDDRTYRAMQRPDGSFCIYYTTLDDRYHWIVCDSIDREVISALQRENSGLRGVPTLPAAPSATDDELAAIEARAKAASQGTTGVGVAARDDDAAEWFAEKLSHGKGDIFCVYLGDAAEGVVTAITGNGPTSEANAKFYKHAHADIPRLLERTKQAESALAAERAQSAALRAEVSEIRTSRDLFQNELIKIREMLNHADVPVSFDGNPASIANRVAALWGEREGSTDRARDAEARATAAEAERDELRKALDSIVAQVDTEDDCCTSLGNAVDIAHAALNGSATGTEQGE